MKNTDLLISSKLISDLELQQILNPFTEEELKQYSKDLTLSGFELDFKNFFDSITKFMQTGDSTDFYKEIQSQKATTIIRYKKLVDGVWISCLKNEDGAVAYDFQYTPYIKVYNNEKSEYVSVIDGDIPKDLEALKIFSYNDVATNLINIQNLFINSDRFPKLLAIELLKDIQTKLEALRQQVISNKGKYWDKDLYEVELKNLKRNYIQSHNALEDISKPLGYNRNYTDGNELDKDL